MKKIRCAIYTRKSSDEGLEQDFNSLDAQREACAAYVASQKHEGWVEIPDRYDDGGFSGGNMERPGLKQLMSDIRAKRVDVIVVYKVDRLTRSLADFSKIVEILDAQGISFVAVTQQFNTTTSMGRLTLNVLLSFAQFEREIAGERIRDKIKASRQKGMWMGGGVPLGYDVQNRALVINETEAAKVRMIYERYLQLRSVRPLASELEEKCIYSHRRTTQDGRMIGGRPLTRGNLYMILRNPVYVGLVVHKGTTYPGLHEPIVDRETWDQVQGVLAANRVGHLRQSRSRFPSLLAGIVFDNAGERLSPSHSNKGGIRYRYYISQSYVRSRPRNDDKNKRWRIPGSELEHTVLRAVRLTLKDQSGLSAILALGRLPPRAAEAALKAAATLSDALTLNDPVELRARLHPLLSRVEIAETTITVTVALRPLREAVGLTTPDDADPGTHTIVLPVRITKRGVEQKLIVGAEAAAIEAKDEALIKAVARAHAWFQDLKSGKARDLTELAKRDGLPASYVRSHLPLTFLAPSIVSTILDGRQPPDLTLKRLMYQTDLPIAWSDQRRSLGLED